MQISSRFTIAIHMLACMDVFKDEYKIPSDFLASSINVNPVIIRKILSQLKDAGLIEVKRGPGGTAIAKPLNEITFFDVYRSVDCIEENTLFYFHENPNPNCPVGKNIHRVLDDKLLRVQMAMELELKSITLADMDSELIKCLENKSRLILFQDEYPCCKAEKSLSARSILGCPGKSGIFRILVLSSFLSPLNGHSSIIQVGVNSMSSGFSEK